MAPIPPKANLKSPITEKPREPVATGIENAAPARPEFIHAKVVEVSPVPSQSKVDEAAPSVTSTASPVTGIPAMNRGRYEPEIPAHWLIQDKPSWLGPILVSLGLLVIFAWSWNHFLGGRNAVAMSSPSTSPVPAMPASAHAPERLEPAPVMRTTAEHGIQQISPEQPRVVDACIQFVERLPSDYVLLAGGEYAGRKLGFQIDLSGHEATGFDVVANMPGRSVVLVLGAYEPSIWKISREPRTRIAGVVITGYYRQAVSGLEAGIPVLNSSYNEKMACGYSYFSRSKPEEMDAHVRRVFGRSAQTYLVASNGQLVMGDAGMPASTVQDAPADFNSFRDVNAPLAGQAGLDKLVSEHMLRPAQPSNLAGWKEALRRSQGLPLLNVVGGQNVAVLNLPFRPYVVQGAMTFPSGLYGAHAATFIVPKGVPRPQGNPGHSAVFDWNTMTCYGATCRAVQ